MQKPTPAPGKALTSEPDRDIADPLEAARAVSDTGKPITPESESAKRPAPGPDLRGAPENAPPENA